MHKIVCTSPCKLTRLIRRSKDLDSIKFRYNSGTLFEGIGELNENKGAKLEARVGIEPTHKGFADLSLTTWVPRLNLPSIAKFFGPCQRRAVTAIPNHLIVAGIEQRKTTDKTSSTGSFTMP